MTKKQAESFLRATAMRTFAYIRVKDRPKEYTIVLNDQTYNEVINSGAVSKSEKGYMLPTMGINIYIRRWQKNDIVKLDKLVDKRLSINRFVDSLFNDCSSSL